VIVDHNDPTYDRVSDCVFVDVSDLETGRVYTVRIDDDGEHVEHAQDIECGEPSGAEIEPRALNVRDVMDVERYVNTALRWLHDWLDEKRGYRSRHRRPRSVAR
jgi:hypothetical protein